MRTKAAKSFVPASGPSREVNERDVDPQLASMRELYSLIIACRSNRGTRTTHVLPPCDEKRLEVMKRAAKFEGFEIEIEARGDGAVVTVSATRQS